MIWIEVEARLVLAGVFAVSAASKLRSARAFASFEEAVARLGGVPGRVLRPVSAGLAGAEALLAVAVLVPATAFAAVLLSAVMLLTFSAALARALRAGEPVRCNCFGPSQRPVSAAQLTRNGLLIALAAAALTTWPSETSTPADVGPAPLLICLLVAVVTTGAITLWDDLADLFAVQPAPRRGR
ncbi:MauE/DoxX family redox-associated membrane protein [Streptomyces sp. CA-111067]|uniref:MauE/DoxX family redox-associated membrane protein n=1 Tax=Streptomyces sp. CA-111067 TaxID=3240046 RepID=UPI003D97ED55